ncbi:rab-GTPase-TBC domain-containing protein [Aspergillus granulosus]|uniref:Rab-GTPase-TBC domain-containing protein n=1 Tax=Aspergillus granulosus TaxID=176169 RepID=A0ABR4H4Q8_9EURO
MRGIEDSRQRWNTLFHHRDTPSDLRNALKSEQDDDICTNGLRSICWKAFLLFEDFGRTQWPSKISEARSAYVALKAHFLKYIEHPDDLQSSIDPLADDEQSPWQTLREDEQMRAEISQDVDRCLQENVFFREPATKAKMIDILFIYSKLNPDLGYRQGMHELLAPLLWVVDKDAIEPKSLTGFNPTEGDEEIMAHLLDPEYVEHDAFSLFCSVMQNTRVYYEHNRHRSVNGQADAIPIVLQCEHIHNDLLVAIDMQLADHLQALEILPQIFLTRWMRLLFGREFPFQDILIIWDLLFAEGLRLELIDFICVAMLLRVRWQLLSSDSSAVLTTLLRYPSPHPHDSLSFVHDGLYLEQNPTSERGAFLISKYSGKPPDSSKMSDLAGSKLRAGRKFQFRNDLRDASEASSPSRSPARSSPLSIETLLQDVSEGIQRRTETWGVAKAVRGAVNEAKKNMQAIQSDHTFRATKYSDATSIVRGADSSIRQDLEKMLQLKSKVESLEERNRTLAKTLGQVVNDLRSQVMKSDGLDGDAAKAVEQALTKIQSVQTTLETPCPTPDAKRYSSASDKPQETKHLDNSIVAKAKPILSENTKPERSSLESPTSDASIANPPIGRSKSGQRNILSAKPLNRPQPLRHVTRPSLADSGFSWMLGEDRHLSTFVSPASVPPEQTRHGGAKAKPNALFGNGDAQQKGPQAEPDGMALNSLRGAKR